MHTDSTPAPLVDIDEIAGALGLPASLARTYLESRHDHPVAAYRGRSLWLADTMHDAIAEHQEITTRCRVVPAEEFLAEPGQVPA